MGIVQAGSGLAGKAIVASEELDEAHQKSYSTVWRLEFNLAYDLRVLLDTALREAKLVLVGLSVPQVGARRRDARRLGHADVRRNFEDLNRRTFRCAARCLHVALQNALHVPHSCAGR